MVLDLLIIASAMIVLWKTVCQASRVDLLTFAGHRIRHTVYAVHWALLATGAGAIVIGRVMDLEASVVLGALLLLLGVALLLLVDRRRA